MSNYVKIVWFVIILILIATSIFLIFSFHGNTTINSKITQSQQIKMATDTKSPQRKKSTKSVSDAEILNAPDLLDKEVSSDDLLNMSYAEREQFLNNWSSKAEQLTSQELVAAFVKATVQLDDLSIQFIEEELVTRAHEQHDSSVVPSILDIFTKLPEEQQSYLINLLDSIANIDSLNGLLYIASDNLSPKIKDSALYNASQIGMHVTDSKTRDDLTVIFIETYNTDKTDTDIKNACVNGIRSLNTTSGQQFLQTMR